MSPFTLHLDCVYSAHNYILYLLVAQISWNGTNVMDDSVTVTSPSFAAKMQPARHRMVYALLKDEMSAEGGIHALQLRTRTREEERQQAQQSQ